MKLFSSRSVFALAFFAVMVAAPFAVEAKAKPAADAATPATAADSGVTVPVTPPAPTPPAPPKAVEQPTADTLSFGDLTVTHPQIDYKNNHIDIFLSIKNASKGDERLGGVDTTWKSSGVVQVTKDKDGKETEGPVSEVLPAEKSVDLTTAGGTWLRIKDVQTEPKNTDLVQVTLYFRRSPNAVLKIAIHPGKAAQGSDSDDKSSIINWLKH